MAELLSSHSIESALTQYHNPPHIYIGYSGGVDSHVLLHLCASMAHLKEKITAVYVHHGLQLEADAWAEHCKKTATDLGVDFKVIRVDAIAGQGESPEEVARNARYTALRTLIETDDLLLVAQHREDQLETVLLQLFRGSGLSGLSAMPAFMNFGKGVLLRPLLDTPKIAVEDYAKLHALSWIEDPSNQNNNFNRNFLRNAIVPLLKQRWPACDKTVARSAGHCSEAQLLLSEQAKKLFLPIFNILDETLSISQLIAYSLNQQRLVIREWFQMLNLKMPSQAFIERVQSDVISARPDSDPLLSGKSYCIRRYRDKLYCLKVDEAEKIVASIWPKMQISFSFSAGQALYFMPSSAGICYDKWQKSTVVVKARSGGEKISLPGRKGHHDLKQLFQEAGIAPWERAGIPLIYLDDKLAVVGNLWISADFYSEKEQRCISFFLRKEAS
jgi:tRNA(Ile)-lysidine synthase